MHAARKLLGILLALTIGCLLVVTVAWTVLPLTGSRLVAIRTGSMAPSVPPGSLVLVTPPSADEPKPGQIVTFSLTSGAIVTHRVVAITGTGDTRTIVTRGDANAANDAWTVEPQSIQGVVRWWAPALGRLALLYQRIEIRIALMAILLALVVVHRFWVDIVPTRPTPPPDGRARPRSAPGGNPS
ncbi:MAG TPA: signal peptidase I [Candidatus Limnocylindrales bacterium]|nr:signal peptidase I [Candidatus Limnocylindrales bacterium]